MGAPRPLVFDQRVSRFTKRKTKPCAESGEPLKPAFLTPGRREAVEGPA